ncbi:hypothetical protein LINPERPRIM_LOCUS6265 [Linum perenne]
MLRPVISSGLGFGARRWLTNLQRSCECMNILKSRGSWPKDPRSRECVNILKSRGTWPKDPTRKYLSSLSFEYCLYKNKSN